MGEGLFKPYETEEIMAIESGDTPRTLELIRRDKGSFVHPFGMVGEQTRVIWEKGYGARLWDTNGKEYIDLSSGYAQCVHLGFSREELNDAIYTQLNKLSHVFVQAPFSNVPAIEYASDLSRVLPGTLNHVYFCNSGTEACEMAVKAVRAYWHHQGRGDKYKIISLQNAYHGASHFAGSISGAPLVRAPFGVEFPGIIRSPSYHCYSCALGLRYPECNMSCADYIRNVIETEGKDTIACMIAEPVQGVAGVLWPRDEYWPMVAGILKENDIVLIVDEVQTGFCRTGKFWGIEHWDVAPDIVTMGKGISSTYIPLGAVALSDRIYDVLDGKPFLVGVTASGNTAAMACAKAALKIYVEEDLSKRAFTLGEHMHTRLVEEFLSLPCVDDINGRGLYQSFEIVLNKDRKGPVDPKKQASVRDEIFNKLMDEGVLVRIAFNRRLYLTPALVIGESDLDSAMDVLLKVMKGIRPQ